MKIGMMRYPLVIEHKVVELDPIYGTEIVTWETFANVWANIAAVTGREYVASPNLAVAATTSKITMRYLAEVDSTMRIKHDATVYGIDAILPDERRSFMTLMCTQSSV